MLYIVEPIKMNLDRISDDDHMTSRNLCVDLYDNSCINIQDREDIFYKCMCKLFNTMNNIPDRKYYDIPTYDTIKFLLRFSLVKCQATTIKKLIDLQDNHGIIYDCLAYNLETAIENNRYDVVKVIVEDNRMNLNLSRKLYVFAYKNKRPDIGLLIYNCDRMKGYL